MKWLRCVLAAFLALAGCTFKTDIGSSFEKPYTVVSQEHGMPGTERFSIVSDQARSAEERGYTARRAAIELAAKTGAKDVRVFLEPSMEIAQRGFPLAIVNLQYGRIKDWQVSPAQFTSQEINIMSSILATEARFPNDPDDVLTFRAVSKKLGVGTALIDLTYTKFVDSIRLRKAFK